MIEFSQTGYVLTLESTAPVQFSRGTPVQVTLGDDTFTAADSLALNIVAADGRNRTPLRVPLTASGTDGVYTGKIGRVEQFGLMMVALSGTVSTTQVITSAAAYVPVYQSVDPEEAVLNRSVVRGTLRGPDPYGTAEINTGLSTIDALVVYKRSVKGTGLLQGVYNSAEGYAGRNFTIVYCDQYASGDSAPLPRTFTLTSVKPTVNGGVFSYTPTSEAAALSPTISYTWIAMGTT